MEKTEGEFINESVRAVVNSSANDFVGLRLEIKDKKEIFTLYFPMGYHVEKSFEKKEIYNFLNLLSLYHNKDVDKQAKGNHFSMFSAIKIVENYLDCGLYKESIVHTKNNSEGKINWKKTLANNQYLVLNMPIDIYSDKINYNYEGKVQKIQKYCLGFISKVIKILFKFNFPSSPKPYSDKEMLSILYKELALQNVDSKRECLSYLISFIENSNCLEIVNDKNTIIEIGTRNFEYIWEKLIDVKFNGLKNKKELQPRTTYYFMPDLITKYHKKYNAPMRPDTIIREDNLVAILDAKYYANGNLPEQYDINKQLGYATFAYDVLSKKLKNIYIRNIFILPWNMYNNGQINEKRYKIECYATNKYFLDNSGNVDIKSNEFKKGLSIIAICYVDTKSMINLTENQLKEEILNNIINEMNAVIDTQ